MKMCFFLRALLSLDGDGPHKMAHSHSGGFAKEKLKPDSISKSNLPFARTICVLFFTCSLYPQLRNYVQKWREIDRFGDTVASKLAWQSTLMQSNSIQANYALSPLALCALAMCLSNCSVHNGVQRAYITWWLCMVSTAALHTFNWRDSKLYSLVL